MYGYNFGLNMAESGKVYTDPLFIGLTRPQMFLGVGMMYVILYSMTCLVGFILSSNFYFIFAMAPLHYLGFMLYSKDPYIIEVIMAKFQLCSRNRMNGLFFHGANSYDPY